VRRAAAWGVHAFTASSAAAGILAVLAAERGAARTALAWMAYSLAVDSIDGTLARAVEVKRVLPMVDGTRLDDIVDYFTYVIVPVLFLLRFDLLPPALAVPVALCPVLASAYGFCRTDAKTPDHYFTGFPSYWNIVAFYLYAFHPQPWVSVALTTTCAVLTFVPTPYLYATRGGPLAKSMNTGSAVWFVSLGLVLFGPEEHRRTIATVSLVYPAMYLALSAFVTSTRKR